MIFPIGQLNFRFLAASIRLSNRCREQHGAVLLSGTQSNRFVLKEKWFVIIWSGKRTSRATSLPFESTYLVDRYLRSVDRSSCTLVRSSPRTNVHHRVSEKTIRFLRYFTVVFGIGSISIGRWTMNFSDDVTALTEIENRRARMKNPERIESQKIGRRNKGWSRIDLYERERVTQHSWPRPFLGMARV